MLFSYQSYLLLMPPFRAWISTLIYLILYEPSRFEINIPTHLDILRIRSTRSLWGMESHSPFSASNNSFKLWQVRCCILLPRISHTCSIDLNQVIEQAKLEHEYPYPPGVHWRSRTCAQGHCLAGTRNEPAALLLRKTMEDIDSSERIHTTSQPY
jgi:hypothetical protein